MLVDCFVFCFGCNCELILGQSRSIYVQPITGCAMLNISRHPDQRMNFSSHWLNNLLFLFWSISKYENFDGDGLGCTSKPDVFVLGK